MFGCLVIPNSPFLIPNFFIFQLSNSTN
jgi:hypothetical protein